MCKFIDSQVSFFPDKETRMLRRPRMSALGVRHLLTTTSAAYLNGAGSEMYGTAPMRLRRGPHPPQADA